MLGDRVKRLMPGAAALFALLPGVAAAAQGPVAHFTDFTYRGADPVDRTDRPGPARYRNPILQGFYPDPSVTRVGADYYLANSTFGYFPGLPIFHSRDLVSWTQIGNALDRPGQMDFKRIGLSRGIFAPDLTFHDGLFYLAGTCVDCGGNFVMTAARPQGPWSQPVWNDVDGIDPSLFFDADGRAWMLNNGPPVGKPRYEGHRAIWVQAFDPATRKPFGPRTVLVDGGVHPEQNPIWAEGPHLFTRDGWYYLMTAEGGTAENHSEVIYRSRSVTGPYTPGPRNPILTQRGLDPARPRPITSAGHADFVTTPAGDWWATFLATRPYRDDLYTIGRETFLLPVTWRDGWPQVTAPGSAIPYLHARPALPRAPAPRVPLNGAFAVREPFTARTLAPAWMMIRTPGTPWYRLTGHALDVTGQGALGGAEHPAYLARRVQHHHATTEISVRFTRARAGDRAGLVVLQDTAFFYALSLARTAQGDVLTLERRDGAQDPADGRAIASVPYAGGAVRLRIVLRDALCDFQYAGRDGTWRTLLAGADATILSTHHAGGFIGATIGPFARAGV